MSDDSSYVPYEHTLSPIPRRRTAMPVTPVRQHMVAPNLGPEDPYERAERDRISRELWGDLNNPPAPRSSAANNDTLSHTPHPNLSNLSPHTQGMWGHIGQGCSVNLHDGRLHTQTITPMQTTPAAQQAGSSQCWGSGISTENV